MCTGKPTEGVNGWFTTKADHHQVTGAAPHRDDNFTKWPGWTFTM